VADRIQWTGENKIISSRDAISISLALHELATNAVKYGALANDLGRIRVSWKIETTDTGSKLHFEWREEGGPPVSTPVQPGFGSRLLKSLAAQSGATYDGQFSTSGFRCQLTLPLEATA
jgi:two-component sensor histidine kinase